MWIQPPESARPSTLSVTTHTHTKERMERLFEWTGRQAGKQAGSLPVEEELFRGTWCTFGTYPAGIVSVRFRWSSMSALSLLWLLKRMSVRPSIHPPVHQSVPTTAGAMFICPSAAVSVHGFICLSGWRIKNTISGSLVGTTENKHSHDSLKCLQFFQTWKILRDASLLLLSLLSYIKL